MEDIAELTDINSRTFYAYYSGVYRIVEETENEIVKSFEAVTQDVPARELVQDPYLLFSKLSAIINADMVFSSR